MKIAIHQMCSTIDPYTNMTAITCAISEAAENGASFYFAPEMSGLLDRDRSRAQIHIVPESENSVLSAAIDAARRHRIWVHLGSLPILNEYEEGKFANRSFVIDSQGMVRARYDKMHLFDVQLDIGENWRESNAYTAGNELVAVNTPLGLMGLSICYDMRFSGLYAQLAQSGATIFAIPAAFTIPTGTAHWHSLLKARAIESAAFVVAAAQCGLHEDGRATYGHSLVVDPWGEILLDMETREGIGYAQIDLSRIEAVRRQIPVHENRRSIPKEITFY
jgi:deaminated glutathione amidase